MGRRREGGGGGWSVCFVNCSFKFKWAAVDSIGAGSRELLANGVQLGK